MNTTKPRKNIRIKLYQEGNREDTQSCKRHARKEKKIPENMVVYSSVDLFSPLVSPCHPNVNAEKDPSLAVHGTTDTKGAFIAIGVVES